MNTWLHDNRNKVIKGETKEGGHTSDSLSSINKYVNAADRPIGLPFRGS